MRMVVFAPPGRRARAHQQRCVAWCEQQGHQVAGITSDPAAVEEMLSRGAEVAVVARDAHGRQLPEVPVVRIPRWRGYGALLPTSAAPAGWLAARARDHPALTAGLAAAAAGLVTLPLIAPEPERRLPAEQPPAVAPAIPPAGPTTGGLMSPSPTSSRPAASPAASAGPAPSPPPGTPPPALPTLPVGPVPTPALPTLLPPAVPTMTLPEGGCLDVRIGAAGLHVCLDPPGRSS